MEVRSKEAAQKAVKRGAELSALLACTVAKRDERVLKVQEKFGGTIGQLSGEISQIETALVDWARGNRSEFAGKKILSFPCGVLSIEPGRRRCKTLPRWTWAKVLKTARRLISWRKYVRIKFEIDRQRLLADTAGEKPKLNPSRLQKIGLQIARGPDAFNVEFRLETKLNKKS
jgi:phage host-nuclease inhibitor protein Gam